MKHLKGYILLGIVYLFAVQPFFLLRRWRDLIFLMLYYVIGYRKKVVMENLRNSFPEKSEEELEHIARKFYFHLSNLVIETLAFFRLSSRNMLRRIKFHNTELLEKLYDKQKNIVLVMGHYGMWEWMLVMPKIMRHTGVVVYKPLNDRFFDEFMKRKRTQYGGYAFSMRDTLRGLIEVTRKGNPWLAAFVADQTPTGNEINFWVKFLSQDTPVFLGPEKIAKRFGAAVVYAEMRPAGNNRYNVYFDLITEMPEKEPEGKITVQFNQMLEQTIRKAPQYWLWSHRRWKHKHLKDKK